MKALVLGAQGQVGTDIVLAAPRYGIQVMGYGSKSVDVTQLSAIEETVKQVSPDIIINASAYTAVDRAEVESDKAYAVNQLGVENIGKTAQQHGIPVLHISTDYVYSGKKTAPYIENDLTQPLGVYGASKLAGEKALLHCCPESLILRTSWVYGCHGKNFVKTMLSLAEHRDELSIVSDQHGCPTFAEDIAHTLLKLAKLYQSEGRLAWGVYHYSGGDPMSWYHFATQIFSLAKQQGVLTNIPNVKPIPTVEYPTPAQRPLNSVLNCEKILTTYPDIKLSQVSYGLTSVLAHVSEKKSFVI